MGSGLPVSLVQRSSIRTANFLLLTHMNLTNGPKPLGPVIHVDHFCTARIVRSSQLIDKLTSFLRGSTRSLECTHPPIKDVVVNNVLEFGPDQCIDLRIVFRFNC